MAVHGRLFLISTFVGSVALCVGSKLAEQRLDRSNRTGYFRLVGDGSVVALHFVYLVSARECHLVGQNESFQLVVDSLGSAAAGVYVYLQFMASVVGNHYMTVCASDIVLEYFGILLEQRRRELDPRWRAYCALLGNVILTALNCHSVDWTTATFAVYMKSLFMSFWMAKIWFNREAIQAFIVENRLDFLMLCALTTTLLIILICSKELNCFPHDVISANHTVLIPLYERLAGICAPELPIIAACYGAGSMNIFFVGRDPAIQAARSGQLPFPLSLIHPDTKSPVILLAIRALITVGALAYLQTFDLALLAACWDFLLLTSAILFDIGLLRARHVDLNRSVLPTFLLHAGFQLACSFWIFHRLTQLRQVTETLLFIAAVTIVAFKATQSEPFVRQCCNRLQLECSFADRPPVAAPPSKDAVGLVV